MIKIRSIKKSDIKSIATIHRECWQTAYRGLLPQSYLNSLTQESFERRWTNGLSVNNDVVRLVATKNSQPIGFIVGLENRTPEKCPESSGEIWALYVHPSHWEKGAGKLLFREFQKVMKGKGHKKIFLLALESHARRRAFYEKLAGVIYPATQSLEINGGKFLEVAYVFNV